MGDPANSADGAPATLNRGSKITPYFTPEHAVSPARRCTSRPRRRRSSPRSLPLSGATLRNRIAVSPMFQYSAALAGPDVGALTDYHIATLGHYALKGAGCVIAEATGVEAAAASRPTARACGPTRRRRRSGACSSSSRARARPRACSSRTRGARAARRRPGSGAAPGPGPTSAGGPTTWPARRAGRGRRGTGSGARAGSACPCALREEEMPALVEAFAQAARRAARAGADLVEIHSAHGSLLHQFLSPVTNRRTDGYGGSFEGRTRLLREVVGVVRAAVGERAAVFVRISTTDSLEGTDVERPSAAGRGPSTRRWRWPSCCPCGGPTCSS